ncbi:MAG: ribosome-binding factor A [Myxococcota bacterium]
MTIDKKLLARMQELCEQVGPDDGLEPRARRRSSRANRKTDRKVRQLCGQVNRTLSMALAASRDPILQALTVEDVSPNPDASRLRVDVRPLDPDLTPQATMARLDAASGRLRAEVARSIQRKRTPNLSFGWVPWEVTDER